MDAHDDKKNRTLLTTREVGQQIRCGEPTVRRLIRQHQLRAMRVGKRLLVPDDELAAYLARAGAQVTAPSPKRRTAKRSTTKRGARHG